MYLTLCQLSATGFGDVSLDALGKMIIFNKFSCYACIVLEF